MSTAELDRELDLELESPVLCSRVETTARAQLRGLVHATDLSVVFQPIVEMNGGSIFAYEALVRCRHLRLNDPPTLFRRAVEENMAGVLGRVIRELVFAATLGTPVFVNIHPHELREPWLMRSDDPIFGHSADVYLEVTEAVPLLDLDECREALRAVRSAGSIHLVVDDLGAGFSNLKRISDLEPSIVKVDRNLITGLPHNSRQQRLLKGVVRLCEDLGARVVAEGIENPDEFAAARDAGAHFGQGFLMARPGFPLPATRWRP